MRKDLKTAADFKNGKLFNRRDAIVYAFLLMLIIALFIIFALPSSTEASGFYVYVEDELVLTIKYGEEPVVHKTDKATVIIDGNDFYVYFNEEKTNYNKITVTENGAKITDATCSLSRDCVYEPTIKNDGAIYCVPHRLKIVPILTSATPPLTGGNAYVKNA